jgi:Domain of unknown function (DUF1854)
MSNFSQPVPGAGEAGPRELNSYSRLSLAYDAFGRLLLTTPSGMEFAGVIPTRGFPFSSPGECISFCDDQGRELFFLPDLALLAPKVRELLEADLARREFIPVISAIYSVSTGAEPTDWHVATDRGNRRFVLTSEDSIRRMGPYGALITDSFGIRFRIADSRSLDPASRRILRRYL